VVLSLVRAAAVTCSSIYPAAVTRSSSCSAVRLARAPLY